MLLYLTNFGVGPIENRRKPETQEDFTEVLKVIRGILLFESDWTQLPDTRLTEQEREDWRAWRDYVRSLPEGFALPLQACIEIAEPPTHGRPAQWANLSRDLLEHIKIPQTDEN